MKTSCNSDSSTILPDREHIEVTACGWQGLAWCQNNTFVHVQNRRIVAVSLSKYSK